jgi:hypothetical protein
LLLVITCVLEVHAAPGLLPVPEAPAVVVAAAGDVAAEGLLVEVRVAGGAAAAADGGGRAAAPRCGVRGGSRRVGGSEADADADAGRREGAERHLEFSIGPTIVPGL